MLADKIEHYKQTKMMLKTTPAAYKTTYDWLKEVDSLALANAQLNLDKAYKHFFRNPTVGFPKFKNKKTTPPRFTTNNQKGTVAIQDGFLRTPKLKSTIRIKLHRPFSGVIKSCTISKTPTGNASALVETDIQLLPPLATKIGVDLGLKAFATTSNGEVISNPKHLRTSEKRLAKLQNLARKREVITVTRLD